MIAQFCGNEHLRPRRGDDLHDDFEKDISCLEEITPLLRAVLHQILSIDVIQYRLHRFASEEARQHADA